MKKAIENLPLTDDLTKKFNVNDIDELKDFIETN
jgi:hypothetical protein